MSDEYTSLVISAKPIARTGGSSDQMVPVSTPVVAAMTNSVTVTARYAINTIFLTFDIVLSSKIKMPRRTHGLLTKSE